MAILPGAQITMGDIVDNAFTLLKSSVDNIDAYTNNAENEYFLPFLSCQYSVFGV